MPDVVYDALVGASTNLRQVTNSGFDPHLDFMNARESGNPVISDQFLSTGSPEAQLTTVDIGGFIAAFGTTGGQTDGANILVPYQKRQSGGTFKGGSTNMTVAGITTCPVQLVPQQVTAPRQGSPTASGQLHFLSVDGITVPYVESVNQSLSAQAFDAMYGLGPCFINGTKVPRQVGFTVTFGVGLSEKQHYDGAVWPSDIFLETFDPVIEIQVEDFDQISSIATGGVITSCSAYLRKRLSGSSYSADTNAAHVKFSFASGMIVPQALRASETKHGSAAIRLIGRTLVASNASTVTT